MNNTVENDCLGFPETKWPYLTGEVYKSVISSCQIFSEFNKSEIIKIGYFWQSFLGQSVESHRQ